MRIRSLVLLTTILCCSAWGQTYTISTFAGGGLPVNIPGTSASLGSPASVVADRAGNVFLATQNTVLRLDATTGILTLVAGNGTPGFSGDNGLATSAQLYNPEGVAVDSAGNVYIADSDNYRVRKVSAGVIATVAGNGSRNLTPGFSGSNGPAVGAQLYWPSAVAVDSAANLYIADSSSGILGLSLGLIYEVSNAVIAPVAGSWGTLDGPTGIAVDSAGNLILSEILRYCSS